MISAGACLPYEGHTEAAASVHKEIETLRAEIHAEYGDRLRAIFKKDKPYTQVSAQLGLVAVALQNRTGETRSAVDNAIAYREDKAIAALLALQGEVVTVRGTIIKEDLC